MRPPSAGPPWRACSSSAPGRGTPSSARVSRGASCARGPNASPVSFADSQQPLHARRVVVGEQRRAAQLALVFGRLLLEDVARERVPAPHLAGAGHLEPLLRAGVSLHLGHERAADYDTAASASPSPGSAVSAGGSAGASGAASLSSATGADELDSAPASFSSAMGGDALAPAPSPFSPTVGTGSAAASPSRDASTSARPASTALEGAIIIVMLRPSCIGRCSTTPSSESSSASRSRIAVPRSGWVTSRPRNMIVTLTLSLWRRNRSTWCFLVS